MHSRSLLIGVDASSFLSMNPRGEGKTLLRLCQEISILRPEWKFIFYGQSSFSIGEDLKVSNCEIKCFDLPGYRFNFWMNVWLPFHAWRDKVDILYCSSTFAPFISTRPYVLTVHDIIPLVSDSNLTDQQKKRFKSHLLRSLSNAKAVISVSQNTKDDIGKISDVNQSKIKVVHWGCDIVERETDETLLKKLKISLPYIMAFGGNVPRKNTGRILEAFKCFNDKFNKFNLVLIGINSEKLRDIIIEKCKSLGIYGKVILMSYVSESELATIYSFADCLLYPSLYEGFGMPLVEAMSRQTPVITSNISSMPEVIGDAGLQVNPYQVQEIAAALEKVLSEDNKIYHTRLLNRAEQFQWRKSAEQVISIFESI